MTRGRPVAGGHPGPGVKPLSAHPTFRDPTVTCVAERVLPGRMLHVEQVFMGWLGSLPWFVPLTKDCLESGPEH